MSGTYPLWAEIDLGAIRYNINALKSLTKPGTRLMAVIKAEAYGHGLVEVARAALESGADSLGVARASEGILLREKGIESPVVVFGLVAGDEIVEALKNDLTLSVYDWESAVAVSEAACSLGKEVPVHIKVDTGMGRLGFQWDEDGMKSIEKVDRLQGLKTEGIYTHFACADARDKTYTREQFNLFMKVLDELKRRGVYFSTRHAANSAALIDMPETHLDMVRPGLSIYGLYPFDDEDSSRVKLKQAMSLKTRVVQVKEVGKGFKVSYGCTYETPYPTVLATLAVGYADGYTRLLSSKGEVLVHGKRAPVVGRVCMDQCIVDVGHIPGVSAGDEAVIIGGQDNEHISPDEIAGAIGTINYEILTMISSRVPRLYLN